MKIIEVIADSGHADTVAGIAEQQHIKDHWSSPVDEDGRAAVCLLVADEQLQTALDTLQTQLGASENSRILVIPVEVTLPRPETDEYEEDKKRKASTVSREELYHQVEKGTQLNMNFILLVVLSAIVAAIGMLENNVAVIVGAMVIAPLLGPNIAFSLGTSLGETRLAADAIKTLFTGIFIAVVTGVVIGGLWSGDMNSAELMLRTDAFNSGTAIALASGAAASLSLVSSVSTVLVGVMVAVALMPPAVTIGLMLSVQDMQHAAGAGLLLAVNIVCINLAAKLVFLYRGVKPRSWLEARKARQSQILYIAIWILLLLLLSVMISFRHL